MIRRILRLLLILAAVAFVALGAYLAYDFMRREDCFAQGGRWDREADRCEPPPVRGRFGRL